MYIRDTHIRQWLLERMEPTRNRPAFDIKTKRRIIYKLNAAELFEITDAGASPFRPGQGLLFVKYRYNLWLVAGAALLVLLSNLFVLRLDIRQKILGRPHPERTEAT